MKLTAKLLPCFALLTAALGLASPAASFAAGKPPVAAPTTPPDVSPAPGGGGGSRKPTLPTAPAPKPPVIPITTAALTFTPAVTIYGVTPVCTGSYQIDPYYPTLSLLTLNLQASSMNVADGTVLYVNVYGTSGTIYSTVTSTVFTITAQSGTYMMKAYITPGTVIQSVVVADASGTVILNGN